MWGCSHKKYKTCRFLNFALSLQKKRNSNQHTMKTILTTYLFTLALLLGSCGTANDNSSMYDCGISQELALSRKENIKNPEYILQFSIPQSNDSAIHGNIDITFDIDAPQEVIIDFREEQNICSVNANGNATTYKVHNEHIIIPATALACGHNSISISFIAGNQSLNRNDEFLYTLLVPDRARTVFPCFDQPDMKATFKLALELPEAWSAISNSPVTNEIMKEGNKLVYFAPTEPLSTYLFSFVAGIFQKEEYNDGKHSFSAYHRETEPDRIAQFPTIFSQVAMSLDWLEEYTGVPYPFAKYDLIILPGFQYGGMEHTGATLYNDTKMFLSKTPTPDEELDRASLIAHETAHMWFGDYVTMQWFNDVWTKEVFANYFASRITEPMFPEINHRLNWLKNTTTAALGEDRTMGGTAIRQELDNMSNAGLIYNNIIYNKAPVMLEKLVEIMGEEAFREGIHDYLTTYSYGNATWDGLIAILDGKSEKDLATFSDVWVNSKGMPHISFSIDGNMLVAQQSDPYKRELTWPQSFKVRLVGEETTDVEVVMDGTTAKTPIGQRPMYILPNSDGRGYGYFRYDSASLAWVLENWHTIEDETCRQAQLMNMHEAFQHGEITADRWLNSLLNGLPSEENPLIASTICSYIGRPLAEANNAEAEKAILLISEEHKLKSCRQQLLRTLISTAGDSIVRSMLYNIWYEASHPLLNENDYMNLAYELAIRNPNRQKEIIATQYARIKNPDRQRQFAFIARATTPDTLEQKELFRSLLKAENRRTEPWALKTLGYLCHPLREDMAVEYIREALDSLQYIQRTSDIFFPQNWTRTLLRERHSIEALHAVEGFLKDNKDFPPLLKSKILQATWNLHRRNVVKE